MAQCRSNHERSSSSMGRHMQQQQQYGTGCMQPVHFRARKGFAGSAAGAALLHAAVLATIIYAADCLFGCTLCRLRSGYSCNGNTPSVCLLEEVQGLGIRLPAWVFILVGATGLRWIWSQTLLVICLMRTVCGLILQLDCMVGCSYWLVVWNPLFLDPSNGVFGRFDRSSPLRLPHLKLFV